MKRLLVVSNRLPVTVKTGASSIVLEPSTGGLATGMRGPHEQSGGLWIGWTGLKDPLPAAQAAELSACLAAQRLSPVELTRAEVEAFYEGFSNGILWPLFHHFLDAMPLDGDGFAEYRRVNERFADAVVAQYREGDVIWVHDYQLMLLPAMLRERLPAARIGFFLHIPFPPQGIFRTLPAREEVLAGVLGADVIGFHTAEYARNFEASVLRVHGRSSDAGQISWQGRPVQVGVFPMGIDARRFAALAAQPDVVELSQRFREGFEGQLLVGIDRLDYTKGIPRRLLAYERLLTKRPELHGKVRLVQVAVPSRDGVDAYQEFRTQVDSLVGRINGRFSSPSWVPVHYLYRSLQAPEVVALYRAADVMLVTPIRDGMNLVAKEFCATRDDGSGVLVLSELAGAASELSEAVRVNPYDIEGCADAFGRALSMPAAQRVERMRSLRRRVFTHDVHRWAKTFLGRLEAPAERRPAQEGEVDALVEKLASAPAVHFLLDYDGTLVPLAETPELAAPDEGLLALLEWLCTRRGVRVDVVSGRTRSSLEAWLGALPLGLHAEHGLWSRPQGQPWKMRPVPTGTWREPARLLLEDWTERTPGSLVEEKTLGLAWHYRMADPEYGLAQANELKLDLTAQLANAPVEVLHGDKVVELRPHGVHKGHAVPPPQPGTVVVAVGDDRTDEDLFAALPATGVSVAVGQAPLRAELRVAGWRDVRALLGRVGEARGASAADAAAPSQARPRQRRRAGAPAP